MKILKLLLLFSLILLIGCISTYSELPSRKSYKVYKKGIKVISEDCPELRRMIREGQMRIPKYDCDYSCFVHFEREFYEYMQANSDVFFSDLCVKTKDEIDELFGFETEVFSLGKNKRIVGLLIFNTKSIGDHISNTYGYKLNEQDSIILKY
jgi:hypothetical protein